MRLKGLRVERAQPERTMSIGSPCDRVAAPHVKGPAEVISDCGRRAARQRALDGVERGDGVLAQKASCIRANGQRRGVVDIVRKRSARTAEAGDPIRFVEPACMGVRLTPRRLIVHSICFACR